MKRMAVTVEVIEGDRVIEKQMWSRDLREQIDFYEITRKAARQAYDAVSDHIEEEWVI